MLKSDPRIHFDESKHRYAFDNVWQHHSVTRIIDDLSDEARAQIEATKGGEDGWEARGNAVHAALEQFLLYRAGQTANGLVMNEKWADWIEPMVDHWLFEDCIVEAVELRLCDPQKSIAGSLDFIISDKNGDRILGDLKTVKTKAAADRRKPAEKQLGGYLAMLIDSHKYTVDKCVTLIAAPGRAVVKTSKPDDCLSLWLDAWSNFNANRVDI